MTQSRQQPCRRTPGRPARRPAFRAVAAMLLVLTVGVGAGSSPAAVSNFNQNINNDWFTAGNWSNGVPDATTTWATILAGTTANIAGGDAFAGGQVSNPNLTVASGATLNLLASGSLTVSNNSYTAGTTRVLGVMNAAGDFDAGFTLQVSRSSTGSELRITGGTTSSINNIQVGLNASSGAADGLIELSGSGNLNVGTSLLIGNASSTGTSVGNFNILPGATGTVAVNTTFNIGGGGGTLTTGYANIQGGTVVTPILDIGASASTTGQWTQSGGTLIAGDIRLSRGTGGNAAMGTAIISGSAVLNASTSVVVGDQSASSSGFMGLWNQSGGTLNLTGSANLTVGNATGGVGELHLTGGTIQIAGGALRIGANTGSSGTVNLSGGTLITPSINMNLGTGATGTFTLSGSGHIVLSTGTWTKKADNTVNFTGGTVNTGSTAGINFSVVNNGTTFAPGLSIGLTNINTGSYTQNSGGLEIEIAGAGSAQYDRLLVNTAGQSAVFNGGGIHVVIVPGHDAFKLKSGDTFDLVIADTVTISTLPTLTFSDPHFAGYLSWNPVSGGVIPAGFESLRLTLTMVPEPASAMLLGVGIMILRRRRAR